MTQDNIQAAKEQLCKVLSSLPNLFQIKMLSHTLSAHSLTTSTQLTTTTQQATGVKKYK